LVAPEITFDRLCGLLRPLIGGDPCVASLDLSVAEWQSLIGLGSNNFVLSHLAVVLAQLAPRIEIPSDVREYFAAVLHLGQTRSKAVRAQLNEIVVVLNSQGITPVLLKGAAYETIGLYERPGTRLFSDLDVLIPIEKMAAASSALEAAGYRRNEASLAALGEGHHHLPEMTKADRLAGVELHREPLRWQAQSLLPSAEMLAGDRLTVGAVGEAIVPSPTQLALHNILHGQVSNYRHWQSTFLLRDAFDLVAFHRHWPDRIDWTEITRRLERGGFGGVAAFYVRAAFESFGVDAPAPITALRSGKLARAVWSAKQRGEAHAFEGLMQLGLASTFARRMIAERSVVSHLRQWSDLARRRLSARSSQNRQPS
jgi:hypothetical protein